ncbi:UNVERIFIED_CONTAM: hypothetical protein NCL1_42452 [Trichonephila clavipes]
MSTDALEKIKSKRSVLRKLTTLVNKVEVKLHSGEEIDESELHEDYEIILDRAKNSMEKEITASEEYQEKCLRLSKRISRYLEKRTLPKLAIEKFAGDPKNWQDFRNSFESSIDKNDSLSQGEKIAYLKSLLIGQLTNVVSSFELTCGNSCSTTRENLLKRKHYQTKLLSQFWKNWETNYLLNITSFHHFLKPSEINLKVDDVIPEENSKSKFL